MATSGVTNVGPSDNWGIAVEWKRTGVNIDSQNCTIQARIRLYFYTSQIGKRDGYITINGSRVNVSTPAHSNYTDPNTFKWKESSNWATFTVPLNDNGDCTISVYGYLDVKANRIVNGHYVSYRETGPQSFSLDHVDLHNKVYGGTSNNFTKNRYVYKTTDWGQTWVKCDAYKTTNSGSSWTKV